MRTCLSLFDYSGNWSKPFLENGWNVIQVDIKHGLNVLNFDYKSLENVEVILAAPPCTDFASSGAAHWKKKDFNGDTEKSIKLVEKTLEIIDYHNPKIWALENPRGRIVKLVPRLGKHRFSFDPCNYGDPYTKNTLLWGLFIPPSAGILGQDYKPCKPILGSMGQSFDGFGSGDRKTKRSKTPLGFSYAFYKVNIQYLNKK